MGALQDSAQDISTDQHVRLNISWYVDPNQQKVSVSVYFNLSSTKVVLDGPPVWSFNNGVAVTTFTFLEVPSSTPDSFLYYSDSVNGREHEVVAQIKSQGSSRAQTTALL